MTQHLPIPTYSFMDIVATWNFAFAMIVLFILSILYNMLIDWMHQREEMEPYTWLTVVVGVGYTLGGSAIAMRGVVATTTTAVAIVALVFMVTGLPMSAGDLRRYWHGRGNGHSILSDINDDDEGTEQTESGQAQAGGANDQQSGEA